MPEVSVYHTLVPLTDSADNPDMFTGLNSEMILN